MPKQHWAVTPISLSAKAALWGALYSVRAAIGDPGDGSFGWVALQWAPDGSYVDVPMVNLGYLPWRFVLTVRGPEGHWVDPAGRAEHRDWIAPRSVRWVRMFAPAPSSPGSWVRMELCTDPRLWWLRAAECHHFRQEWE